MNGAITCCNTPSLEDDERSRVLEGVLSFGQAKHWNLIQSAPRCWLSQIIAMPPYEPGTDNELEWFEDRHLWGYVVHPVVTGWQRPRCAEWAVEMGDTEHVKRLDALLDAGKEPLQKHLWRGTTIWSTTTPRWKQLDALLFRATERPVWARCPSSGDLPMQNVAKC